MKTTMTRLFMAGLILAGLLTGISCARKNMAARSKNVETQVSKQPVRKAEEKEPVNEQAEKKAALKAAEEQKAKKQLAKKKAAEAARLEEAGNKFVNNHILFAFDSDQLDEYAQTLLKEKAQWLENNPSVTVTIEGHCDRRGTSEYNQALGEHRAKAVMKYLENLGVSEKRMISISFGEDRPLNAAQTEEAFQENRRAQFQIREFVGAVKN